MNSNLHDTLQPDRPFRRRWRRALLPLAVGYFLAAWSVSPLWGQSAAVGLGGTVEDDAPVQILTSDLGRVQTINESHVAVTFVILGQSAIQRVAINGADETVVPDTVVVINRTFALDTPENLIEIAAYDDRGNRRDKSYLVLREQFEQSFSWEERREAIVALIDAGRFDEARVDLGLWQNLGDHPDTVEELWLLLDDRSTQDAQAEVLEFIRTDRFDDAQAKIEDIRKVTARLVVANTLQRTLADRKRTILRAEIEVLIIQRNFDEAADILNAWKRAGDSPDMVADLERILGAWRESPEQPFELRDIHANARVYLQVLKLTPGNNGWVVNDAIEKAEPDLIGAGSGRYVLPGPGEYILRILHPQIHESWETPIQSRTDGAVQVLNPAPRYKTENYAWLGRPPLGLPRAGAALIPVGDGLHLLGGYQELHFGQKASDGGASSEDTSIYLAPDSVDTYSTLLLNWDATLYSDVAPERGFIPSVASIGDRRFVLANSGRLWEVEADWSRWREIPTPLSPMTARPTVAVHDGKLYVFGGMILPIGGEADTALDGIATEAFYRFDPASETWAQIGQMPRKLGGAVAAAVGGRIYVFGGHDGAGYATSAFAYVPADDRWETLAPIPTARAFAAAAVVNDRIYVLGGEGFGFFGSSALDTVEIFDPAKGTWSDAPDMPTARKDPAVGVAAGAVYVVGGFDGSPLTAFDVFATSAHLTPPADLPQSAAFGSRLRRRRASGGSGETMVRIPAGEFTMGREVFLISANTEPEHRVSLQPFLLDKTEVSQSDFALIMGFNPSSDEGPDNPVDGVTWFQASQYCEKIGKRLPTEAEWEYAARDNSDLRYPFGDSVNEAFRYENFCGSVCEHGGTSAEVLGEEDGYAEVAPTRSFYSNSRGLFDMLGNVSEWVADWYGPYSAETVESPVGPPSGETKVVRGASFQDQATSVRVTDREELEPDKASGTIGFRCAADVKEAAEGDANRR